MNTPRVNEVSYEEYTARERARLEMILDKLQAKFIEDIDPATATAILKTQARLDRYVGFKRAPKITPPVPDIAFDLSRPGIPPVMIYDK